MLRIFYGRENIKKDKFIFDSIEGRTLLLVPDQFTLQAERDAFFYLGAKGLMDLEVVSISRLGLKILSEVGGGKTAMIDKYGRHMLLTKILSENKDALGIYRGLERKSSFVEMVNNFISELKQYGTAPEKLDEIAQGLRNTTLLKKKLEDISLVFHKYEEAIEGKYLDTEDYASLYTEKISQSAKIRKSCIWIYGFDSFTPKNKEVIRRLIRTAPQVNLVLTCSFEGRDKELFSLTRNIISYFCHDAEEAGIPWQKEQISESYKEAEKAVGIQGLEQELYAIPVRSSQQSEGVTLVKAANFYSEAEAAAAKVRSLVRDRHMAYKDILLICNDLDTRGSIIRRVFSQYDMDLFVDKKQGILHNPASVFLLSLLEISRKGYGTEAVFRLLKTGLTPLCEDEVEQLENYTRKYRIRGNKWKQPFSKGAAECGEQGLKQLEESRQALISMTEPFRETFRKGKLVKEKVQILYGYLVEVCELPQKLEQRMRMQQEQGYLDAAGETAQIWGLLMDVLDQFVEIVGEESLLAEDFDEILKAGMESIEVGLLPPSVDGLILGTMQRTRSSHVKATLILGANEGLLPASAGGESILNEDEKRFLAGQEIEICKVDEIRMQEEKLAIYKNLSKPGQLLWISCSVSDGEGKEIKPSRIFSKIKDIYPELEEETDPVSRGAAGELLQAEAAAMEHMTAALRGMIDGQEPDPVWRCAAAWYRKKGALDKIQEGLFFTNAQEELGKELADRIYKRDPQQDMVISPSGLEQYSRCPFSYLIRYGLRPDEQRIMEMGSRELGDLYHVCLMEISKWLTEEGIAVNDPGSRWMTVSGEECEKKVESILLEAEKHYREGILSDGKEEVYRTDRLKEICSEISWIMIDHVRRGSIQSMYFEQPFGLKREIPPVIVETAEGTVRIEGKIDRVDVLENGKVKIIDYKTGNEKFNVKEAKKGFRLQLMLYLRAAQQQERKPAGIFYFLIHEPEVNAEGFSEEEIKEKVDAAIRKSCRMDGIAVDDAESVSEITGDFSGYSDVIPVRQTKKGVTGTGPDKLMDEEAFRLFQEEVDQKVEELCGRLLSGTIEIKPQKSGEMSACTYCSLKGICQFDPAFEACKYEII